MPTQTETRTGTGHEMTTSPVQSTTPVKPVIDHAFALRNGAVRGNLRLLAIDPLVLINNTLAVR
jgi:hypothetical protein